MVHRCIAILFVALIYQTAMADDDTHDAYTYDTIASRYADVKMDTKTLRRAKMEGECLVGLKNLNFKKKEQFDAVAEWSSYRSFSLLSQFSPCTVLVIMEVAQDKLKNTADK